ncbi:hypothetical protein WJX81_007066 [Elliptochloris bilobata]|uniref:Uncharacterized protein n=1 Tax=Elliptochloris bilobata TaxID=381761 RepID=A0AAW1RX36_9CHLO
MLEAQRLSATAGPEQKAKLLLLKDDLELKHVFEDIQASGAEAMEKYWNDTELMSKIAAKMGELNMGPSKRPISSSQVKLGTLHAAAKAGDADILRGLIDGGADVNQTDARGISALGVAVGFNRLPAVQALLAAGAKIDQTDARGNTVLHYAAGYGRKEVAELLLGARADAGARNGDGQRPVDVAEVNREMHMVAFLRARAGADVEPVAAKFL